MNLTSMEEIMKLQKKIKCVACGSILECNESTCVCKCSCGKVAINNGIITEGVLGVDYTDVSPKILNG